MPPLKITRWWFQIFFCFHPYLGKIPILTHILQMGWNHQRDKIEPGKWPFGRCSFFWKPASFSASKQFFFWEPPRGFCKTWSSMQWFWRFWTPLFTTFDSSDHPSSPSPKRSPCRFVGHFLLKYDFWRRKKEDVDMDSYLWFPGFKCRSS